LSAKGLFSLILFRYLTREILTNVVAVSVTLLVIVMSARFVKYLAQAASGDMAPAVVFSIMACRIPHFLELVLPLGLFIGILLAYGRLYVESEMTVMSACGLSTKRLSLYTLIPSLFVALVVAFLSLYASPNGEDQYQKLLQDAKNSTGLETLVSGRFRVDKKTGRVTYIKSMSDDNKFMQDVFFVDQTAREGGELELSVIFADKGRVQRNEPAGARYLILDEGYRYIGQPGAQEFQITQFERFGQLLREQKDGQVRRKKTDARSTLELLASEALEDKATLQWRISLALLVPIIALIAQSLSRTNHRRGRYVKMLPAFLLYIFYLVILTTAREAIEEQSVPLALGMWWVHGLFLVLAISLLFGPDWWRKLRTSKNVQVTSGGPA
jgi:lipopolysaccharide export system permease protein